MALSPELLGLLDERAGRERHSRSAMAAILIQAALARKPQPERPFPGPSEEDARRRLTLYHAAAKEPHKPHG